MKVGRVVTLKKTSPYFHDEYNPLNRRGMVTRITSSTMYAIKVDWGNGFENCYNREDLTLKRQKTCEWVIK